MSEDADAVPYAVRAAEARDAPGLTALIRALNAQQGDPTDRVTQALVLRDLIEGGAGGACHVAAGGGRLLGYATAFRTYESGFAARGRYIGDLYVVAAHRRRGIARALLASFARLVRAEGGDHLWLTAKSWNEAAHALYRSHGALGEQVLAFAIVEERLDRLAGEAAP